MLISLNYPMEIRFFFLKRLLVLVLAGLLITATGFAQAKDGTYKEFYTSGKIKVKGHLKDGLKNKQWLYYDESGKLKLKEKWSAGQLQWKAEYEDGKVVRLIDKDGNVREKSKCGC